MYQYSATLEKGVDADTALIQIDLGFGVLLKHVDIRLSQINAPEKSTPLGQTAIAFVNKWFADNPTFIVTTVKTKSLGDKKERYGRILGTFSPLTGGKSLNQALVDAGLALPYNGKGKKPTL